MLEENKISFSANGTGVVLHSQYGDLHFTSEEYTYYDLIFKITDYLNEGGLSVRSSQLLSLLARTNVPWSSLEKAIQIATTSAISEDNNSDKSLVEEECENRILTFPHFLILAKLLAYYQEKKHLPSKKTIFSADVASPPVKTLLNFQLGQLLIFPPQFQGIQHQFSAKITGHHLYHGENYVNSYVKYSIECTARPFAGVVGEGPLGGAEGETRALAKERPAKQKKKSNPPTSPVRVIKTESKYLVRLMRDSALLPLPPPFSAITPDATFIIERRYNEFAQFYLKIFARFYGQYCLPPLPDKHSVTWLTFLHHAFSSSLTSSLTALFPATSSTSASASATTSPSMSSSPASSSPLTSFVSAKESLAASDDHSASAANGGGSSSGHPAASMPNATQIIKQRMVEFQLLLSYALQHPRLRYCFELRVFLLLQTSSQLQAFFQLYDQFILPGGLVRSLTPVTTVSTTSYMISSSGEEKEKKMEDPRDLLRHWYAQGSSLFHSVNENLSLFTSRVFSMALTKPYPKLQPGLTHEGTTIGATTAADIQTIQTMQAFYATWQTVVIKIINCFVLTSMCSSEHNQLSLAWKELAQGDTTLFTPYQQVVLQFSHSLLQQAQREVQLLEMMSVQVVLPIQYHGKFATSYEKVLQTKSQLQKELWDSYAQEYEMRELIDLVQSKYHLVSVKPPPALSYHSPHDLLTSSANFVEEGDEEVLEEKEDEDDEEEMIMIDLVECEDFQPNGKGGTVDNDMIMTQSLHLSEQADTQKDLQAMKVSLLSYERAFERKKSEEALFVKNLSYESARLKALHQQQLLSSMVLLAQENQSYHQECLSFWQSFQESLQ